MAEESSRRKVWYAPNQHEAFGREEMDAVARTLEDGWLAPGPRTAEFERRVSALFSKRHGVMVNSGSSANLIALLLAGVGPDTEVVTPACTFATTVAPIVQLGATPVFIDVQEGRFVPSVDQVVAAITERTVAIMLPNLAGQKPDWARLRSEVDARAASGSRAIVLIEDSCDTITSTPESDLSTTSFYASHVITAGGTGGMVMMNSESHVARALTIRDWGRIGNNTEDVTERFGHVVDGIEYDFKFLYGEVGYNFKACEMNAAFGLAQLDKLERFMKTRRAHVERYLANLEGTAFECPDDTGKPNWLAFPLLTARRGQVLRTLEARGIQTRVFFAGNITRHPAYRTYLGEFPNSDRIMRDAFLVGAHHGMTADDVDYVCEVLREAAK